MRKPKRVKIIRQEGMVSLVEWLDTYGLYHRSVIPSELVDNKRRVSENELNRGVKYGEDWSEVMDFTADPDDIEQELYRVGIWTGDDILDNPDAVRGAIQKVLQNTLASLFRFANGKGV